MRKKILDLILLISMLGFSILFAKTSGPISLFWKTLASTIFMTLGFMYFDNQKHSFWLLLGMFYSFVADVLLQLEFIFGAIVFVIAHIIFIISFSKIQKLNIKDLKVSLIFTIITIFIVLFVNYINPIESTMLVVMIIYCMIISLMTSKALMNYITEKNRVNKILFVGAFLFLISDMFLLIDLFGGFPCPNVITYYISMYYLAKAMNYKN